MKLSKSLLTLVVATSAVAIISTSCEKQNIEPEDGERTEKCDDQDYDCPMCGMG